MPRKRSRRRRISAAASMRSMAASGVPHTPLVRNNPTTCPERQYGRKARTISSGPSEQRGVESCPARSGQYLQSLAQALDTSVLNIRLRPPFCSVTG